MKYIIALLFAGISAHAQSDILYNGEHINALDANNKKTGIWKAFSQKNNLVAVCEYKDDQPITPTRYYKDAKLLLSLTRETCIIYHGNDSIQAKKIDDNTLYGKLVDNEGNEFAPEIIDIFKNNNAIQPMYYEGLEALYKFVAQNIDQKKTRRIKGKVIVKFNLDKNGFVENVEIAKGADPVLDEEAVKAVMKLPRWQPGLQNGAFVRIQYMLPVTFN